MAIAFLALSRRERGAVTTVTDTASARLAADAALANAEGQIMANALATTNPYNFGLLVSTNYINPVGFNRHWRNFNERQLLLCEWELPSPATTFLQNLANLYYSPRPPVFISPTTIRPAARFPLLSRPQPQRTVSTPTAWVLARPGQSYYDQWQRHSGSVSATHE